MAKNDSLRARTTRRRRRCKSPARTALAPRDYTIHTPQSPLIIDGQNLCVVRNGKRVGNIAHLPSRLTVRAEPARNLFHQSWQGGQLSGLFRHSRSTGGPRVPPCRRADRSAGQTSSHDGQTSPGPSGLCCARPNKQRYAAILGMFLLIPCLDEPPSPTCGNCRPLDPFSIQSINVRSVPPKYLVRYASLQRGASQARWHSISVPMWSGGQCRPADSQPGRHDIPARGLLHVPAPYQVPRGRLHAGHRPRSNVQHFGPAVMHDAHGRFHRHHMPDLHVPANPRWVGGAQLSVVRRGFALCRWHCVVALECRCSDSSPSLSPPSAPKSLFHGGAL